jgi:lupus La protein
VLSAYFYRIELSGAKRSHLSTMSGEVKATEAPQNGNADAEKDVQDLLAELKGDEEKTTENGNAAEASEEARIIAEATKLGEESAVQEQKAERSERPFKTRNYRDNIKSDLTSQKTTDDPVEIRKQVCAAQLG